MNKNELQERTKKFAHDIVKISVSFPKTKLGMHLQDQLIRCSTSVAANYRAACLAQSKAAFIAKLSIVVEEADESGFWLEFLRDEKIISENFVNPLLKEALELTKIFISARKTASLNHQSSIIAQK